MITIDRTYFKEPGQTATAKAELISDVEMCGLQYIKGAICIVSEGDTKNLFKVHLHNGTAQISRKKFKLKEKDRDKFKSGNLQGEFQGTLKEDFEIAGKQYKKGDTLELSEIKMKSGESRFVRVHLPDGRFRSISKNLVEFKESCILVRNDSQEKSIFGDWGEIMNDDVAAYVKYQELIKYMEENPFEIKSNKKKNRFNND